MEFACDRCQKRFSTSYQPMTGRVYRIPCRCGNTIVLRFDLPRHAEPPRRAALRMTPPPLPDRYVCMANGRARADSTTKTQRPASLMTPPPLPDRDLRMANGRARVEPATKTMTAGACAPAPDATPPVQAPPVQTPPAQQTSPTTDGAARVRLDPTASPEVSGEYPLEPSTSVPFGLAFALSRRRAFLAGCGAGAGGTVLLIGAVALVAWVSGPRSENPVTPASTVTIASKTEQAPAPRAPAPRAAAKATAGGDRAAPDTPRRVKQASRVVAAPVLAEELAESHPTAVDREAAASAGDDEGRDSPASDDGTEPTQIAEAEDGEGSDGAEAQAQTTEEQGLVLDEAAADATEAPAQADEASDEPERIALVPAVVPEQTPASDGASGAPANEDRGQ